MLPRPRLARLPMLLPLLSLKYLSLHPRNFLFFFHCHDAELY